ncbi:uncharacterized protein TRIVIDRAFT_214771 [Trichoderma virens Gv29-8]|uniref:Uncharacterized protein n=1 Tax=Hypocrea virens (strain Gv29-8 / FGSC 10586) TaxID=413071 RepID=G9NCC9_HYPVG|nr:uncharacterized protein TRIVIDRAFT_214771 [Trichoderma virens Gv29-8]EHK15353.1 hypothetical protein TRIVIDRAFT_214771 [Trichoderma virens Gv29-8]
MPNNHNGTNSHILQAPFAPMCTSSCKIFSRSIPVEMNPKRRFPITHRGYPIPFALLPYRPI